MQVTTSSTRVAGAGPVWWGAAAGVVALCTLATVVSPTAAAEPVYVPTVVLLAAGFAVVVRRRRLRPLAGWTTFAVGLGLLALGDVVYALPFDTDLGATGLSGADPLYLLGSLVLAAGALRIKGVHAGEGDREALLDAASIGLATAVLLWHPLIEPRLDMADTSLASRLVTGSYPVLDVVVLAMLLWLLLGGRRWTPAAVLLVAGAAFYLTADLAYTIRIDRGVIDDPGLAWLDTLWLVAYGLFLLAALHPSASTLGARHQGDERPLSRSRLLLSGLALLAPLLAVAMDSGETSHLVLATAVEAILIAIVLVRISNLASGEHRARQALVERERYFRSLVENASEAMVVLDHAGVVTDTTPAVRPLLEIEPDDLVGHRLVDAVVALDRDRAQELLGAAAANPAVVIAGEVSIAGAAGGLRWLEMRTANLLGDPAVKGLVVNLQDVTARHRVQVDLERRAFSDPLTGLPNRALFQDRLDQLLERREPPEVAVIYCDLDGFKEVNDRFGHAEGDRVLTLIADRLAGIVRAEDTVARLGGDEFAVLVHGDHAGAVAGEIARRIVDELGRPVSIGDVLVPVSVSAGVAQAGLGSGMSARTLTHGADEAMYRAKRAGGSQVIVLVDDDAEDDVLEFVPSSRDSR